MATTTAKTTTIELMAELPDDGRRYELLRGELIEMPPSGLDHSEIVLGLGAELRRFVRQRRLGRVTGADGGYVIERNPDTMLAPDAAFTSAERLPLGEPHPGFGLLPPDLVVEVMSPHDRYVEVAEKTQLYLASGVRLVWIVLPPQHRVHVYANDHAIAVLHADDTLDGGDVLPGFSLKVAEIFE